MRIFDKNFAKLHFLCKLLIEANAGKVERAIKDATLYVESGDYILDNLTEKKEKLCVG